MTWAQFPWLLSLRRALTAGHTLGCRAWLPSCSLWPWRPSSHRSSRLGSEQLWAAVRPGVRDKRLRGLRLRGSCGQHGECPGVEVVLAGTAERVRAAGWMEVRGEVLSRLCGVGTFLPWVLGCHPDFESHFCYKPGCCGRLNLPGGGGQNGCGEGCGPVGGVEASVEP